MLSGLRDEVVPPEQMKALWEVVGRRQGVKTKDESDGNGRVGEGKSQFIEFERGTHSQFSLLLLISYTWLIRIALVDDTCVQEGYWTNVADFVASLGAAEAPNSGSRL